MEDKSLKNRSILFVVIIICLSLISCNKIKETENSNKSINNLTFQRFIPYIIEGKKNKLLPSMSIIFENEGYLVKQFDEVTFIIQNKKEKDGICIKYSAGDNIYLNKESKPTAIFLLNEKLFPRSVIYFEKNTSQEVYKFSKIKYENDEVYQLISFKNEDLDILSMRLIELKQVLENIETGKITFEKKIEMPDQFSEIPLWEISW